MAKHKRTGSYKRAVSKARQERRAREREREFERRQLLYELHKSPGPYTDAERSWVEGHKATSSYRRALEDIASRKVNLGTGPKPSDTAYRRGTTGLKTAGAEINLDKIARPAAEVLDQTTRVSEAIMGATKEQIKRVKRGQLNPDPAALLKAGFESGVSRSKRTTGKDVLNELGVKGTAADIGGVALDIAGDPLTYVGPGAVKGLSTGARATRAGARAAERAAPKRAALATPAARKAARKARSQAARKGYTRSVKRSRRVGLSTDIFKPGEAAARDTAAKAFPTRPSELTKQEYQRLVEADRRRRGVELGEGRRTARRARGVRRVAKGQRTRLGRRPMSREQSARIRDAIEAQDLSTLTPRERRAAELFMREQERLLGAGRAANIEAGERINPRYAARSEDEPAGYVARVVDVDDPRMRRRVKRTGQKLGKEPDRPGSYGGRVRTRTVKETQRTKRGPASELRQEEPGAFIEDLEATLTAKGQKAWHGVATTGYRKAVREMGRPATPNAKVGPGEAIYVTKETDKGKRLVEAGKRDLEQLDSRDAVVLKRAIAEHANRSLDSAGRLKFFDPATNKIKWALTIPNPQYWARNAYGGLTNVWLEGTPARRMVTHLPRAVAMNRRVGRQARMEELGRPMGKTAHKTVNMGKAGTMRVDELIREMERVNVSGGGQTQELLGAASRPRGVAQSMEDLPRVTAYLHFRRKGLSPDEASQRVQNSQFDYGQLTGPEKTIARRIFPFYTWRSRNIAFQAKSLVQRPGKYATIEKLRDAVAEGADLPDDWEDRLTEGEGLQLPIPIPGWKDSDGNQKVIYPALPITDLNMADPRQWFNSAMQMVNPAVKNPIEFATGYSFYWRERLEGDYSRWVPAPAGAIRLIDRLSPSVREGFEDLELIRWSSKDKTWHWRGKTDYVARMLPITSLAAQGATAGRNKRGQDFYDRAIGWTTGLRPASYRPAKNDLTKLYDEKQKVDQKLMDLSELGTDKRKSAYTAETARLKNRANRLDWRIYDLSKRLGQPASEPQTSRDKRYYAGYIPQSGNQPDDPRSQFQAFKNRKRTTVRQDFETYKQKAKRNDVRKAFDEYVNGR